MTDELYMGIMSGTSVDGIDVVISHFDDSQKQCHVIATHEEAFPQALRTRLQKLISNSSHISLDELGRLDRELGLLYAQATNHALESANLQPAAIAAIGCHGQTIRHQPDLNPPFTMQLGDGATLAVETGIATINDFRSADIALGGQGAPLVCGFHAWAFAGTGVNAVINIGGIANMTVVAPGKPVSGYDTGPGNTLLDGWCELQQGKPFDEAGAWARSGNINTALLEQLLSDPYFARAAPKSTGRELFNMDWLNAPLASCNLPAEDVQATLTELTAVLIGTAAQAAAADNIWLCGGGAYNDFLVARIADNAAGIAVATTETLGVAPAWVEACAFAWLARARLLGNSVGAPSVTGADRAGCLGALHLPPGA